MASVEHDHLKNWIARSLNCTSSFASINLAFPNDLQLYKKVVVEYSRSMVVEVFYEGKTDLETTTLSKL